jgi:hypothetical protein
MQVRIGEPIDPAGTSAPQLREQVMALREDSAISHGIERVLSASLSAISRSERTFGVSRAA